MVDSLTEEFRVLVAKYLEPVCRVQNDEEDENASDGSDVDDDEDESDDSMASDASEPKRKAPVPDAKKRGGLMKLAQAFSGSRSAVAVPVKSASMACPANSKVKLKTEDVWDTPDSSEAELKHRKHATSVKSKVHSFLVCSGGLLIRTGKFRKMLSIFR